MNTKRKGNRNEHRSMASAEKFIRTTLAQLEATLQGRVRLRTVTCGTWQSAGTSGKQAQPQCNGNHNAKEKAT